MPRANNRFNTIKGEVGGLWYHDWRLTVVCAQVGWYHKRVASSHDHYPYFIHFFHKVAKRQEIGRSCLFFFRLNGSDLAANFMPASCMKIYIMMIQEEAFFKTIINNLRYEESLFYQLPLNCQNRWKMKQRLIVWVIYSLYWTIVELWNRDLCYRLRHFNTHV